MPIKSRLAVEVPDIDLPSFILDGIPDTTAECHDKNLSHPFLFSAEHPETTNLSLVQFKRLVKYFAAGLHDAGFQTGEHLMLISPNYVYSMIICLGTIAAGGVFCTSQPDFSAREYEDQFRRDEPKFLLVCNEESLSTNALRAWHSMNGGVNRIWIFDEFLSAKERSLGGRENADTWKGQPFWTDLLNPEKGPGFQWRRFHTKSECMSPCQIFYTSGTTGLRKGALVSHRNLVAAFIATSYRFQSDLMKLVESGWRPSRQNVPGRILHTISIARGFGTSLPLAVAVGRRRQAIEVYFMSKTSIDMQPYLECLETLKITEVSAAPFTMIKMFASHKIKDSHSYDFSSLRSITVTGAPSSQSTLNGARDFLLENGAPKELRIERALGITEAGSIVSNWRMADTPAWIEGYQGRLEPNFEAKIMMYNDENETNVREVPTGQAGELWLKSPTCIAEYYKNREATEAAFSDDGWYKTGDIAYFDDDKLFLIDRKKDILKTPDNIPPAYIEGVLLEHPDILDAGVVGIYKPEKEFQVVRAYVVKRPDANVSAEEICRWMEKESSPTAHLTAGVEFLDRLPRNEGGKLIRRKLQERAMITYDRESIAALTLPNVKV